MDAFPALMAFQRETEALAQVAGRLGWDQGTVMPEGSGPQRADEIGAMESVLHARRSDPRIGDWLEQAEEHPDEVAQAQMRLIRRDYARSRKVPAELAAEIAKVTSRAHRTWVAARAAGDFAAFAPSLERVVALRREEGAALAQGGDVYDALLQDYEPGMTGAQLDRLFGALRPRLVALRARIMEAPPIAPLTGVFNLEGQMAIARGLADAFGYDFTRGRMDRAVHPFSSGSGNDVRITTRTEPDDPFNCFYSTIHEVGHAVYEQNIDQAYLLTPLGRGASMGVHESQSRIFENQLGRSRAFCGWLFRRMRTEFGTFGVADEEAFYRVVNQVKRGFVRTEADEVQYNLHVLMRLDLERQLIAGSLDATDLDEAWNARFAEDFGYAVDKPANGALQDVHWGAGLFGYFPTYTLGNVYAGCLYEALRRDVPDLDEALAEGRPAPALAWLRDKVQCHGGRYRPAEVIERACGAAPSEAPLLDYLEEKFADLYDLPV